MLPTGIARGGKRSSATALSLRGTSNRALVPSGCRCHGCVLGVGRGDACILHASHPISAAPKVSRPGDRGCPSRASRQGMAPRPARRSWDPRRLGGLPPRSAGCSRGGQTHWRRGHSGPCWANAPSSAGSMGWPSRLGLRQRGMAFSACLGLRRQAPQRWSGAGTAPARASRPGQSACGPSKATDARRPPLWPLGRGRWVAGRRCARGTGRRVGNGVGGSRRPTSETNYPKPCSRRPRTAGKRSGWPQPANVRRGHVLWASPPMKRSIPKQPSAWPKSARCAWPLTIAPRSPGDPFARPIRAHRRLPPCVHGPLRPEAVSRV
jgi:hypothetical protein